MLLAGHMPEVPAHPVAVVAPRAQELLAEMRCRAEPPAPHPAAVSLVARTAQEHGLELADLLGRSREAHVARARHRAMALLRWSTGLSLPAIGRLFGRDHTTVLEGVRKHEARAEIHV